MTIFAYPSLLHSVYIIATPFEYCLQETCLFYYQKALYPTLDYLQTNDVGDEEVADCCVWIVESCCNICHQIQMCGFFCTSFSFAAIYNASWFLSSTPAVCHCHCFVAMWLKYNWSFLLQQRKCRPLLTGDNPQVDVITFVIDTDTPSKSDATELGTSDQVLDGVPAINNSSFIAHQ